MRNIGAVTFLCCLVTVSSFHDMFGSFGGGGGKRKGNRGWNPFDVFNNFGFNFDFPNTKFKQYDLNEIPAGSKKVIRDGNGQGVMFRSRGGNAGGFTFTSGNGAAMSMGGTVSSDNPKGDWVYSSSFDGQPGKVVFGTGKPFFGNRKGKGKGNFMKDFFNSFFQFYNSM